MKTLLLSILSLFICANPGFAQASGDVEGNAAFLFAYYPKEGMQSKFDEGYIKHLQWHQNQDDPLVWYGWYVLTGDRLGMFIDGTFGISFSAFDNRVNPGEDRKDFQQNVSSYGDAMYRKVFKLDSELSTVTRLEDWNPTPTIEVYAISIVPGREPLFEKTIRELASTLKDDKNGSEFTIYRQLVGGSMPTYLLMVPHTGFSYFDSDSSVTTLSHLINRTFKGNTAENLLNNLSSAVDQIHSETWLYRKDLSYFPGN